MPTSNINHVVLTGRLTRDPELRSLPSGTGVCLMRVAVNGRRRGQDEEWVEKPNFFDVVVYGVNGENTAKHLSKGRAVAVDGRLDWHAWEAQDGRAVQTVRIIARSVQFLDKPSTSDKPSTNNTNGRPDHSTGELLGIDGDEEDYLDIDDQDALAQIAA